jgi:hypothetical protein
MYLTISTIESKSKEVEQSPTYRRTIPLTDEITDELDIIRDRIINGYALPPRYYRKDRDTTPDELLDQYGIMHLHLCGQNSNIILYLIQYNNFVIFLELSDHGPFTNRPVGAQLQSHKSGIDTVIANRKAKIKSGLNKPPSNSPTKKP